MTFRLAGHDRPLAYVAVLETPDVGTVSEWACLPGAEDAAMGLLRATIRDWRDRGVPVAHLAISTCHPLRPLVEILSPEDQTGQAEIWMRVQDRALYVKRIRPVLDQRARSADLRVRIHFTEGGDGVEIGSGRLLRLGLKESDLCCLIYNGRRLPGLLDEGGITLTPDDGMALPLLFPNTGATRCAQDVY